MPMSGVCNLRRDDDPSLFWLGAGVYAVTIVISLAAFIVGQLLAANDVHRS